MKRFWAAILTVLTVVMISSCAGLYLSPPAPGSPEPGKTRYIHHNPNFYFDYPETYLKLPANGFEKLNLSSPRLLPKIQLMVIPLAGNTSDLDLAVKRYLEEFKKKQGEFSVVSDRRVILDPGGVQAKLIIIDWNYMGGPSLRSQTLTLIANDRLIYFSAHGWRGRNEPAVIISGFKLF